jgi:hypothetical protein
MTNWIGSPLNYILRVKPLTNFISSTMINWGHSEITFSYNFTTAQPKQGDPIMAQYS